MSPLRWRTVGRVVRRVESQPGWLPSCWHGCGVRPQLRSLRANPEARIDLSRVAGRRVAAAMRTRAVEAPYLLTDCGGERPHLRQSGTAAPAGRTRSHSGLWDGSASVAAPDAGMTGRWTPLTRQVG